MILSRAPVRISFGGGGTDLPAYYESYGGFVISTAINYYAYTILTPTPAEHEVQIISADYRAYTQRPLCEDLIWGHDLQLPKAITYYFNVQGGVTIFLATQVPPGTGLGSSGSVAVAMVKALAFWCGLDLEPAEVAELACYIEIEKMGMPVGKQDQYAAAFGGLNAMTFTRHGVTVEPLKLSAELQQTLEKRLLLFFTGISRQSSTILRRQRQASQEQDPATLRRLAALKALAMEMRTALEHNDLETFGQLLHESWLQKRHMVEGISNDFLDRCYQTAREAGAVGGKITGAGGGGFLLLYCPEPHQSDVTIALEELGLQQRPLGLEREGVQIWQAFPWQNGLAARAAMAPALHSLDSTPRT